MRPVTETLQVDPAVLSAAGAAAFAAAGCSSGEAATVAHALVEANLFGHDSHGIGLLPRYVANLQQGIARAGQSVRIVADHGALIGLDGGCGFGQVLGEQAMALAIERARAGGVCVVGLANAHHLARIGRWAELCAAEGFASVHFVNVLSRPLVAPWGGSDARLATDPFCVGVPHEPHPLILDFATSMAAMGKADVALAAGTSPFEDAAFAMQAGEIRGPVKSDFGYHVLQLKEIKPSVGRSFEEVRAELAAEEAGSERERAFNDLAGRLVNETLKNPTSLAPAAQTMGLPLQKLGPFPRNAPQGIAANPAVLRAAFSDARVQDGTASDPIEISPTHSVVIRVAAHTPEQAQPLDKVRDAVIAAVRADRQRKAAEAAAAAVLARIGKGESLAAIAAAENFRYNELPGLQRGIPMPTAEANEAIFAVPPPAEGKPSAGKASLGDGVFTVFTVNKVTPGDLSAMPAEQRTMMQQQLMQLNGAIATQAYVDAMRKRFQVKVFEDRL